MKIQGAKKIHYDSGPNMIPLADFPVLTTMAQIYQADLAKIGVTMTITNIDSPTWFDQANNRKYNGMYWSTATRANLLPGTMLSSSKLSDPLNNNSGYKNDAYTQLINQATAELPRSAMAASTASTMAW